MANLRKFGLELECFNRSVPTGGQGRTGRSGQLIAAAINTMGFRAISTERHTNTEYGVWQVKPDVTAAPTINGLEVVSPTLPGNESSVEQVRKVANWLAANGYDVDSTCGYHVHIDAADLTSYECAAVALRYHHRQADINSVLPRSRHSSRWAQTLSGPTLTKVVSTVQGKRTQVAWSHGERYVAVNLQHVASGRSSRRIEFRQHSGTLNASKIIGWYKFLCEFIAETLVILRANQGVVSAPVDAPSVAAPIIRTQRGRRSTPRTVSRVVGTTAAPRMPQIDEGTDYDLFLNTLMRNGVITTDDARTLGWMNGGTNSTNSRLRVTAHWLRRHGAELITTQRNGELAYVGRNGAQTRQELFTQPAQIRQRIEVQGLTAAPAAPTISSAIVSGAEQRDLMQKLADAPLMQGMTDETKAWYSTRRSELS